MNILYTLGSGTYGGMEFHVLDLVKGFIAKGHNVYVWCGEGEIVSDFTSVGAKVLIKTPSLALDPLYIISLARFLKSNSIDVLHSHELKVVSNSLIAGKLSGVDINISHTHTPISKWQISKAKKLINIAVDSFLINTLSSMEIALTPVVLSQKLSEGIKKEKLTIIGNTVDTERFKLKPNIERERIRDKFFTKYGIPKGTFIFGNISRLTKEKGHEVLIRAFAEVSRDFESRLLICGGGTLHKDYTKLIRELGIEDKVIITGYFSDSHKENFFSIFDVFVFPTLAEGFGIVLLEAAASEVPIIASDLEVFKDLFGDRLDYFKSGEVRDLIKKMKSYSSIDWDKVREKCLIARELVVKNYSFDQFISNYENLYKKIQVGK